MSKGAKPNRTIASLPVGNAPYDPLDLRTLAESMAKVVLEQPVHPLAKVPSTRTKSGNNAQIYAGWLP